MPVRIFTSSRNSIQSIYSTNFLIGETGICVTVLRPSGRVEINGKVYQAVSMGEFIEVGESVMVSDTDENQIVVKKV